MLTKSVLHGPIADQCQIGSVRCCRSQVSRDILAAAHGFAGVFKARFLIWVSSRRQNLVTMYHTKDEIWYQNNQRHWLL